jgi:hypothetical protein
MSAASRKWDASLSPEDHEYLNDLFFSTPAQVARLIEKHMAATKLTRAKMAALLDVSAVTLGKFLSTRSPSSTVYNSAYEFLEAERIKEGRPKTAWRIKAERESLEAYRASQAKFAPIAAAVAQVAKNDDAAAAEAQAREQALGDTIKTEETASRDPNKENGGAADGNAAAAPAAADGPAADKRFSWPPTSSVATIACLWKLTNNGNPNRETTMEEVLALLQSQYATCAASTSRAMIKGLVKRGVFREPSPGKLAMAPEEDRWWERMTPKGNAPTQDLQRLDTIKSRGGSSASAMGVPASLSRILLAKFAWRCFVFWKDGAGKQVRSSWQLVDAPPCRYITIIARYDCIKRVSTVRFKENQTIRNSAFFFLLNLVNHFLTSAD